MLNKTFSRDIMLSA